jgi:hypothetical protein
VPSGPAVRAVTTGPAGVTRRVLVRAGCGPYRSAMTFWTVAGVLLVVLLAAMWRMDQNARRRGARVRRDIGEGVARGSSTPAAGDARMHDAQRRSGFNSGL